MKKRVLPVLILLLCLLLPVMAAAAESDAPRTEALHELGTIPGCWSPLAEQTPETELILNLTADRLYDLSADGAALLPSMAAALPRDVTAQYAGSFGIPSGAQRGYAFAIDLEPEARWEDGTLITAEDWLFTLNVWIDQGAPGLDLANLEDFYCRNQKATENVVSLMDAGFSSVEEAEAAGYTLFYVDTAHFWGLNDGWRSVSDGTRLKDSAIPSGVTEMYVSGAYLYDRYLRTGASQSVFQTEFVGISAEPEFVTLADVGMVQEDIHRFVLILENPTTATTLALQLRNLTLLRRSLFGADYATSPKTYSATGPYRIVSMDAREMVLEPNPHWLGKTDAPEAELIRLMDNIGS